MPVHFLRILFKPSQTPETNKPTKNTHTTFFFFFFFTWATGNCNSPLPQISSSIPTLFQPISSPNTSQLTSGTRLWQTQAVGPRNSPATAGPLRESVHRPGAAARAHPTQPDLSSSCCPHILRRAGKLSQSWFFSPEDKNMLVDSLPSWLHKEKLSLTLTPAASH